MPAQRPPAPFPPSFQDPLRPHNPLVAHRWIFAGIGLMLLAALLAVYFAMGLLFWQGQWQLIFHPSHSVTNTPASVGLPFEDVHFDATETGQPLLRGWWIPADTADRDRVTLLYLHDAGGSLADALPDLVALHALGMDVFAFDPRGFGQSTWAKPSEKHWNQDAAAALAYVTSVRHVEPRNIIPVGRSLGATIAANLALEHPQIRGVVMVDPQPPTLALLQAPRWTHILPVRLLARDVFDPDRALHSSSLHKLLLTSQAGAVPAYVSGALAPVTTVPGTVLGNAQTAPALHRFFEQIERLQ